MRSATVLLIAALFLESLANYFVYSSFDFGAAMLVQISVPVLIALHMHQRKENSFRYYLIMTFYLFMINEIFEIVSFMDLNDPHAKDVPVYFGLLLSSIKSSILVLISAALRVLISLFVKEKR